jgi:hypothetical protein
MAVQFPQPAALLFRFNTFGNDLQIQRLGYGYNG